MVGIASFGAYVPAPKLGRDVIAKAWGTGSTGGERSVANNDEDSITMAVEAAADCLQAVERTHVDGMYFASTTAPYAEKECASVVACAADLPTGIATADYAQSLRSGAAALRAACDAVRGARKNVLVAAADCRLGYPRSEWEQSYGDGAAALLISDSGVVASVDDSFCYSDELASVWRLREDRFVRTWEGRWVREEGCVAALHKACSELMKKNGLKPADFAKAVFSAPDPRTHGMVARRLGFDAKTQLADPLLSSIGDTGAAHALMSLVAALETAQPGERILFAAYGDGAEAFVLTVTDAITELPPRRAISGWLSSRRELPSYERYLSYRGILEAAPGEPFRLFPSATATWRDRASIMRMHASRCRQCGLVTFPIQRVCFNCKSRDDYETVRLSDKGGKLFTYSLDNLAGRSDDPQIVQAVVESDEGAARVYCLMTDFAASEVAIGMPVEMTFRRIYEGAGFYNYFWKCRPVRKGS